MIRFSVLLGFEQPKLDYLCVLHLLAFAMILRSIARRRFEQKAYLHLFKHSKELYVPCSPVLEISVFQEPL